MKFAPCRRKFLCRLLCAAVILVNFVFGGLLYHLAYKVKKFQCTNSASVLYLEELCKNYTNGLITGSLCKPLCDSMEIQFRKCLGHGVKLHVLRADWNGNTVILKAKNSLGSGKAVQHADASVPPWMKLEDYKMTRQEFIQRANGSLFYNLAGETDSRRTIEVVEEIFSECDVGGDGLLTHKEMITCWELVETTEYVLFLMLRGMSAALDIYGVCGNMYAVQYAAAEPYLGFQVSWSDERTWKFRVRLALALLDLIEEFEETPYGTLYLCDIQEANFGVVKKPDGSLVTKAIDVDISLFRSGLLRTAASDKNISCSKNSHCHFFTCAIPCNTTIGKCSGRVTSNNLSRVCALIFLEKSHYHPALLRDPPQSIAKPLHDLLYKCAHPSSMHTDRHLLQELKSLLLSSIQDTSS